MTIARYCRLSPEYHSPLVRPAKKDAAGRIPCAYGNDEDQVALAQTPLFYRVAEPERDRTCGGIPVAVDVDHDLGIVNAQPLLRGANDAQVGLVRHQQREVVLREAIAFQEMRRHLRHAAHSVLEHLRAFLVDIMHALIHGLVIARMERTASWHVEKRAPRPIHVVFKIENALVRTRRFQENRPGAIAKEHTGRAILVVKDGGHGVAADRQHFLVRPRAYELRSHGQSVSKAGTRGGQVKAPGVLRRDAFLHQAGSGWEKHVWRNGGKHDQVDLRGIGVGLRQEGFGGFSRHVRRGGAVFDDVAFTDARARANPFVVGLDDFFQIRVSHHLWRNVARYTRDFCRDAVGHDSPCEWVPRTKRT